MNLNNLPNLLGAVQYLCSVNGMPYPDVTVALPDGWRVRACLADTSAGELSGIAISSYVDEDTLESTGTAPDDDCIEVLCDGEECVRSQLVTAAHCEELDTVLEAFFDGELRMHFNKRSA